VENVAAWRDERHFRTQIAYNTGLNNFDSAKLTILLNNLQPECQLV
jgi:hypothetical protein